jgi:hypothetical protein
MDEVRSDDFVECISVPRAPVLLHEFVKPPNDGLVLF